MYGISNHNNFYFYGPPTDMRKSFDGLCGIIIGSLKQDPLSGSVYVFINKRRNRIKLLLWDNNGFWLFYKRLERGTFRIPVVLGSSSLTISYDQLVLLLKGIKLPSVKQRKRYYR